MRNSFRKSTDKNNRNDISRKSEDYLEPLDNRPGVRILYVSESDFVFNVTLAIIILG